LLQGSAAAFEQHHPERSRLPRCARNDTCLLVIARSHQATKQSRRSVSGLTARAGRNVISLSFELCWKFLKAYLEEEHNASCTSPRTCFRSAFRHGVLDDDPFWIDVTVLRNYTVHTYNEQLADYVYSRLAETTRRFRAVLAATEEC
jgi:nucleotidyltransferase substrate binding protein (TIGR01987 family)